MPALPRTAATGPAEAHAVWRTTATNAAVVVGALAATLLAELTTPQDFGIRSFYVVPVCAAAWMFGARLGIVAALAATACGLAVAWSRSLAAISTEHALIASALHGVLFLGCVWVVRRARHAFGKLSFRSDHDALTGLLNRRGLVRAARAELERAQRYGRPLSVAFIDVDAFKKLNDENGHLFGDRVLATLGGVLDRGRRTDIAARVGGDEFVVLLPETNAEAALRAVDRLRARAQSELAMMGTGVTFTTGIITFERAPEALDDLLGSADELLYEGKRAQRGSVRSRVVGATR